MYVHKNHIRSWVVHSFNLKRLDRENIGGSATAIKRTWNQDENIKFDEDYDVKSKRSNTVNNDSSCDEQLKRNPKPVRRFDSSELEKESSGINTKER